VILEPGTSYAAGVSSRDPDGDALEYRWAVMHESKATQTGGDREDVPETLDGLARAGTPGEAVVRAPTKPGDYRLFVYVHDGRGKAGHANIPFRVE
jgi:hypothetical protein